MIRYPISRIATDLYENPMGTAWGSESAADSPSPNSASPCVELTRNPPRGKRVRRTRSSPPPGIYAGGSVTFYR